MKERIPVTVFVQIANQEPDGADAEPEDDRHKQRVGLVISTHVLPRLPVLGRRKVTAAVHPALRVATPRRDPGRAVELLA
jgi:hypothetical protein